jgi:tetratricopeptide (TPR) repeat protein
MTQPQPKATGLLHQIHGVDNAPSPLLLQRAIRECEADLGRVSPEIAETCFAVLATATWKLGRLQKSLEYARRGARIGRQHLNLFDNGIAAALLELGRPSEALDPLLRILDRETDAHTRLMTYGNLAEAFARLGDREAAREALQQAIELVSDSASDHFAIAIQAAELGLYPLAMEYFARFLSTRRGGEQISPDAVAELALQEHEEALVSRHEGLWRVLRMLRHDPSALERWRSAEPLRSSAGGDGVKTMFDATAPLRDLATEHVLLDR